MDIGYKLSEPLTPEYLKFIEDFKTSIIEASGLPLEYLYGKDSERRTESMETMEWIPVSFQPMPKDGRLLLVTVENPKPYILDISFEAWSPIDEPCWISIDSCGNHDEVAEEILNKITAWMYYPKPYENKQVS